MNQLTEQLGCKEPMGAPPGLDPYGTKELQNIIPEILWVRTYIRIVWAKYPQAFSSTDSALKECLNRFRSLLNRCFTHSARGTSGSI